MTHESRRESRPICVAIAYTRGNGLRVIHWHWPRKTITGCAKAAQIAREAPRGTAGTQGDA